MKSLHSRNLSPFDVMDGFLSHFHKPNWPLVGSSFPDFSLFSRALNDSESMVLREKGANYLLSMDLPGAAQKDIDVSVENNVLTIRAHRENRFAEGYKIHRQERTTLQVIRSFTLPADADIKSIKAKMENGVLTISIGKETKAQPKRISIEVH